MVKSGDVQTIIVNGDFNFPDLKRNHHGQCDNISVNASQSEFINTLNGNFLYQIVSEPTFTLNENTRINTLDFIITNNTYRFNEITHTSPLLSNNHGHDILTFNVLIDVHINNEALKFINYRKADFVSIHNYFNNINWENTLSNQDCENSYNIFLNNYHFAVSRFILIS